MKRLLFAILFSVFVLALFGCQNDTHDPIYGDVVFALVGDEEVYMTVGDTYVEEGFLARDNRKDISSNVTVEDNIDPYEPGTYQVSYLLDYEDKETIITRNVYVHYDNDKCSFYGDSDKIQCQVQWSEYLDTYVSLTIYHDISNIVDANTIFDTVESIIQEYHILTTKYDEFVDVTNVKTINYNPTTTHTIDPKLFDLIEFSLTHQNEVNNLFNIALNPVLEVWSDYRDDCEINNNCALPTNRELTVASQNIDPSNIILDEENYTITMDSGMSIDLGGVSKGYISREIITYLDQLDLHGYLLNNGESNISTGGLHPTRDNGKFVIAATDPAMQTMCTTNVYCYATIYLEDGDQLVTSGDYQKNYTVDGELYHHIINNVTLMPERYSRAVSIVYSDPALADLYSTAIFMMPLEDALTFVNQNEDMEAIWYNLDDTVTMSDHFEEKYLLELFVE